MMAFNSCYSLMLGNEQVEKFISESSIPNNFKYALTAKLKPSYKYRGFSYR